MFAFIDDSRWNDLDNTTKQNVISMAFKRDIMSDPGWKDIPTEKKQQVADLYFQKADSYSQSKMPEQPNGILNAVTGGAKQTASSMRTAWNVASYDEKEAKDVTRSASAIPKTKAQESFMASLRENKELFGDDTVWQGVKNVAKAAWDNPKGAMHEVAAQLPNSAVIIGSMAVGAKTGGLLGSTMGPGGTAVGSITGGILGLLFGNVSIETGGIAQEQINEGGYDRTDILEKGFKKGGVISAVDTATIGAARMIYAPIFKAAEKASRGAISNTLKASGINPLDDMAVATAMKESASLAKSVRQAGAKAATESMPKGFKGAGIWGTAMGIDMVGEGVGEYTGSVVAGIDASLTDAVMESMMSIPQSAGEVAIGKSLAKVSDIAKADNIDDAIDSFEKSQVDDLNIDPLEKGILSFERETPVNVPDVEAGLGQMQGLAEQQPTDIPEVKNFEDSQYWEELENRIQNEAKAEEPLYPGVPLTKTKEDEQTEQYWENEEKKIKKQQESRDTVQPPQTHAEKTQDTINQMSQWMDAGKTTIPETDTESILKEQEKETYRTAEEQKIKKQQESRDTVQPPQTHAEKTQEPAKTDTAKADQKTNSDILPKSGKPYKTQGAATGALRLKKLNTTHEAVEVEGGWVVSV